MSGPFALSVEALGKAHVQGLERLLQAIVGGRHGNQMNMVGHQAIGQHLNLMLVGVLFKPCQVNLSILIGEKDTLTSIAALRDVVGKAGKDGSG
jgi:hypothetical protein